MENIEDALLAADRAAAAPFVQTPPAPAWYPLAMAIYFTAVAGSFPLLQDDHVLLGAGVLVVAISGLLTLTLTIRAQRGTWPRLAEAPPEIKRVVAVFVSLAVLALLVSAAIWFWVGAAAGLSTVFIASLAVVWAYEFRLYPAAARQVRQRLV
ncbi:hypothetical protein E8P82_01585 [Arthrobacter echini]|uniref:Transmembrane protein n=1 Tax=Arthrobacter echini TaxID=1529066 RepID=A0A4S5EAI2_9MICC|nr:hypothetical protein [Arthrobacter echini]THJ68622.1 hypothetical protein E8P82_01585 [Arthrobacter echini]